MNASVCRARIPYCLTTPHRWSLTLTIASRPQTLVQQVFHSLERANVPVGIDPEAPCEDGINRLVNLRPDRGPIELAQFTPATTLICLKCWCACPPPHREFVAVSWATAGSWARPARSTSRACSPPTVGLSVFWVTASCNSCTFRATFFEVQDADDRAPGAKYRRLVLGAGIALGCIMRRATVSFSGARQLVRSRRQHEALLEKHVTVMGMSAESQSGRFFLASELVISFQPRWSAPPRLIVL